MADKRIFDLTTIKTVEDFDENTWIWMDKQAPEGEPALPSWKVRGDLFLKVLNNFATKFVPNVATVEGKCYWHGGELYVCNVAYTGDWVPGNFTATSIDALFARKDVLSALQTTVGNLQSALETTNDNVTSLTTYAQNVAASVAPPFDPTRDSEHAYKAGESVTYTDGKVYTFKVDHYGPWNAEDVDEAPEVSKKTDYFVVTDNTEYMIAVVDKDGVLLLGIRADGSVFWQKGIPTPVKKEIVDGLLLKVDKEVGKSLIDSVFAGVQGHNDNSEFLYAFLDSDNAVIFGIRKDGSVFWQEGVPEPIIRRLSYDLSVKVDKEVGKSLIDSVFASANFSITLPEFLKVLTDSDDSIIESIDKSGKRKFYTKVSFENGVDWNKVTLDELVKALKATGFTGGAGDWSDAASLQIPVPRFAVVNITGVDEMPQSKTSNFEAYMQFWDNGGNYFKKKLVNFNAQGNSSLAFPKKNASFDIVNDDDSSFKLKFGDWVSQDSFHLKAYYTDFFRGVGAVGYNIYKSIVDTRGLLADRTWKLANVEQDSENWGYGMGVGGGDIASRIDDGALCFPQGFPCALYLNGTFYGLFAWQLKKHRDNYNMNKSNVNHIHLDGTLDSNFFDGRIEWTSFEVRNPKDLYCMDGTKYDGDNPQELIDPTSASYDATNSKHVKTYQVKQSIIKLSEAYSDYNNKSTVDEKRACFETYFNVDNLIDYQIFCDVTHNIDGLTKNWQWTTWDGDKWFVNAYDLDGCFGANPQGNGIYKPRTSRLGNTAYPKPVNFVQIAYTSRLNARYAELRENGIVTADKFASMLNDWVLRIGKVFYDLEYSAGHWDDVPCNRDMIINSDYWALKVDENGEPVIAYDSTNAYNSATSYTEGDECTYNKAYSGMGWYYTLTCLQSCQGKEPITKSGFKDSLWRVRRWLEKTIENMDVVYNFNNN